MLKIVEGAKVLVNSTTLNAIPVGQVFRGKVYSEKLCVYVPGVFFKAGGPWFDTKMTEPREVIVVRLNDPLNVQSNVWTMCRQVLDYEPLVATLTLA